MTPFQITKIARENIEVITGVPATAVSRCERSGDNWSVSIEVIETKGRIADNDVVAAYELEIDDHGELQRYERINRFNRAQL